MAWVEGGTRMIGTNRVRSCGRCRPCSTSGPSAGSPTGNSSSDSSSGGMRSRSWPSRSWSSGTGRWCWASAAGSCAICTTPRTPSRRRSSCWSARRLDPRGGLAGALALRRGHAGGDARQERRSGVAAASERGSIGSTSRDGRSPGRHRPGRDPGDRSPRRSPGSPRRFQAPVLLCDLEGRATRRRPAGWAGRSGPSRAGCRGPGPGLASG